jgi:hypothetical protein
MDKKEAIEKMIQSVERFAPMTDELMEAIDELRSESVAA